MVDIQDVYIISPHLDDAAFSIGGFLSYIKYSNIIIINVFSKSLYTISGVLSEEKVTNIRLKEDGIFCNKLGAKAIYLGYKDSSLKKFYEKEEDYLSPDLDVRVDPDWTLFSQTVIRIVRQNIDNIFLFPLGIGNHIEHRAMTEIGLEMMKTSAKVAFYEDGTYYKRKDEGVNIARKYNIKHYFEFKKIPIEKKIDIISVYTSQIDKEIICNLRKMYYSQGEKIWAHKEVLDHLMLLVSQ